MAKFKVGDEVKFVKPLFNGFPWNPKLNTIHTIINIELVGNQIQYIYGKNKKYEWFSESEIQFLNSKRIKERLGVK